MTGLQTYIDQAQYDELILHSGVVQTDQIDGLFYEGRQCDDGSLIVVVDFGAGTAAIYSGIFSFEEFFRELSDSRCALSLDAGVQP